MYKADDSRYNMNIALIVISVVYLAILIGIIIMIVKDLSSGVVRQWMRGYPVNKPIMTSNQAKKFKNYPIENNSTLVFDKKKFPTQYWSHIFLRIGFLIVALIVGFVLYNRFY